jgi:hypothetical protein
MNKKLYELYYILLYTIIVHRIPRLKKKKCWVNCDPVFGKHEKYIFRLIKRQMETELAHTECFLLPDGIFGLWIFQFYLTLMYFFQIEART